VQAAQRYLNRDEVLEGKRRCSVCIDIIRALCDEEQEHEIAAELVEDMLELATSMQQCISRISALEREWNEQKRAGILLRHQENLESWIFTMRSVTASRAQK
jgi:hypothetical protein